MLDRLVRLGQGISPAQRNDFAWFKEAWDIKCSQNTDSVGPQSLQAGRSVCCKHTKKDTGLPSLCS